MNVASGRLLLLISNVILSYDIIYNFTCQFLLVQPMFIKNISSIKFVTIYFLVYNDVY